MARTPAQALARRRTRRVGPPARWRPSVAAPRRGLAPVAAIARAEHTQRWRAGAGAWRRCGRGCRASALPARRCGWVGHGAGGSWHGGSGVNGSQLAKTPARAGPGDGGLSLLRQARHPARRARAAPGVGGRVRRICVLGEQWRRTGLDLRWNCAGSLLLPHSRRPRWVRAWRAGAGEPRRLVCGSPAWAGLGGGRSSDYVVYSMTRRLSSLPQLQSLSVSLPTGSCQTARL